MSAADPFATLGLPRSYRLDVRELETRYRELQKALHPDRHAGASASQRRMSLTRAVEVNDAYRALRDDVTRAEALLSVVGAGSQREQADPAFLMEIMELREELGEARARGDLDTVAALGKRVGALRDDSRQALEQSFEQALAAPIADAAAVADAARTLGKLKYYRRFLDEVAAIEDEALG
ncbi:MAG: Fe-S protein assembly co-chaperone HscB [Myxococcales bacterium]|nr:Fe-S protein assembly co-chaperone HscB [Myxococcales bacterium]